MNKIRNIIAFSAFSLMVLALPSIASAQWNGGGYPYPNGGYYPNGQYNGGRYGGDIENVANRLKDNSRELERQIDREFRNNGRYNSGRYGNTGILGTILGGGGTYNRGYGNDNIKRLAEDFRRSANDFENRANNDDFRRNGRWDDDRDYRGGYRNNRGDYRAEQSAQRMLSVGSQLDNELRRMRMSYQLQRQWDEIRRDLSIVASTYGNGRGGRYNSRYPF